MGKKMIGIDIGGTAIKIAIIDNKGTILEKWQIPTDKDRNGESIPSDIIEAINSKFHSISRNEIIGIGVGVPGPISTDGSTVVRAVNLGWDEMPLKSILEKELEIPVCLLNDANAAALGEMWKGAAKGKRDLVFVTLGTGVGGGIIIDGKVINGSHSSGGEIGHIPVNSVEERICGCGNINCLETFSSANGLVTTMTNMLNSSGKEAPLFTTIDIFKWVEEGDQLAIEALNTTVSHLGKAIAGIMNTIDAEEVIIGGGLSEAGDGLILPLKKVIDQHIFPQIRGNYELKKAQLGNDAGFYGAVYSYLTKE